MINSLKSTYGETEETCAELINENFKIIHVHGQLDKLPWQEGAGRSYGKKPTSLEEYKKSAKGIKIIHEKENEKERFASAVKLIENAELIIFLGLNLHNETNLDRLNIKENLEDKQIYGTLKGLTRPQREEVNDYFNNHILNLNKTISMTRSEVYDYTALKLLQEEVKLK